MVLSNKKLKHKLRAAKAALLAASEAQSQSTSFSFKNPEDPNSSTQESLQYLLDSVAQKPRLSKREKRRKKSPFLKENDGKLSRSGGGEEGGSEGVIEAKKKTKKRKRDAEDQGLENGEVKNVNKKKKKKKKKKGKEKVDNEEVKMSLVSGDCGTIDQGVTKTANVGTRYVRQ